MKSVNALHIMAQAEPHYPPMVEAREAVSELIDAACLIYAQARTGRELDLIELAECIDAVGCKRDRRAALVKLVKTP